LQKRREEAFKKESSKGWRGQCAERKRVEKKTIPRGRDSPRAEHKGSIRKENLPCRKRTAAEEISIYYIGLSNHQTTVILNISPKRLKTDGYVGNWEDINYSAINRKRKVWKKTVVPLDSRGVNHDSIRERNRRPLLKSMAYYLWGLRGQTSKERVELGRGQIPDSEENKIWVFQKGEHSQFKLQGNPFLCLKLPFSTTKKGKKKKVRNTQPIGNRGVFSWCKGEALKR